MFIVRAPGYRTRRIGVRPPTDGSDVRIELQKGWSTYVTVLLSDDLQPAPGVEVLVDGSPAGRTDADGIVWLAGDGPPASVTIGDDGGSLEVVGSTQDALEEDSSRDPLLGWTFVVRTR